MRKDTLQWLIPVLLAAGVALALVFYWSQRSERAVPEEPAPPAAVDEPPVEQPAPGPEHPLEATDPPADEEEDAPPLPPLEESDAEFRPQLLDILGARLDEQLVDNRVIERIVATVDNLPREQVAEQIRPLSGVDGRFAASESDEEDEFVLDPDNYRRYDYLVDMLASADPADLEALYRRYYPLLQQAYAELGYPQAYFNDRVIEVIDHLLETPQISGPVPLLRPHVLYEFADPELEALSPGQKLLLRMGHENASTVKQVLLEFRGRISLNGEPALQGEAPPSSADER